MNKKISNARQSINKSKYDDKSLHIQNLSDYLQQQQFKGHHQIAKSEKIVNSYRHIIQSIKYHSTYYQILMKKQIQKCQNHFSSIIKFISQEKQKVIHNIELIILEIAKQYQVKIGCLTNKVSQIQNVRIKTFDQREQNQLQTQQFFQFHIFQINFGNSLQNFKDWFKRYLQIHINPQNSHQVSKQSSAYSQGSQKKSPNSQRSQQQDDIDKLTQISETQFNFLEDLTCDQQLNWNQQKKIIKQRKYKARVDEVIPEATQSKENSIVLSNYQSIC